MEITSAAASASPLAQPVGVSSRNVISSDFQTFLKMLTAQMQNQDPLEPIKSEDFAVQLATFSGVEQQVRTNDLLASLGAQMGLMGMAQLAGWVGMEARAPMPGYFDGAPITLAPNPPLTADLVALVVRDATGAEVQRMTIPRGNATLEWAGVDATGAPLPAGLYNFEIESFSNGALVATDPVDVFGRIVEARSVGGQVSLVMQGGAEVPASLITALREPPAI